MLSRNHCFSNANLSLCGCGFLCIYHAGVCAALREYAPQLTRNRIYGASAGSIAAAGLICNVSIADATTAILQVVAEARSGVLQAFSPTFDLMGIVRDGLQRILPENAHQLCTNRLFISLTRYNDGKNVIVSEYANKKELIQAILCSCFIPIFCGYSIPELRGVKYVDGGFSDNQPVFDQNTITISPFSGESDICPMDHASASILGFVYYNTSIRFNNENFYRFCSCFVPPSQEICSKICRQGFTDALRFLTKNSITPCHRCLSNQSSESLHQVKQSLSYFANSSQEEKRKFSINIAPRMVPGVLKKRKRLDSECEVCLSRLEQRLSTEMTTALFPEILHKTLQEPINCSRLSSQLLNYASSFRIVQLGLYMFDPLFRSFDYALFVLKMLNSWLQNAQKTDFFLTRLQNFIDFLLSEVEQRNLLCSSPLSSQFRVSLFRDDCSTKDANYHFGDFDSFELLKDHSLLQELLLIDYYTAQFPTPSSKREKQPKLVENRESAGVLQPSEIDSGISSGFISSTPTVSVSGVSSDDGTKSVMKRDVALSPVRALLSRIPRAKIGSRRHTIGLNNTLAGTGNATDTAQRNSTQSLYKSGHSTHSFSASKSMSSSQNSQSTAKQQRKFIPTSLSSSTTESEMENESEDGLRQFVGSSRQTTKAQNQQKHIPQRIAGLSNGEYDAEPSSDT